MITQNLSPSFFSPSGHTSCNLSCSIWPRGRKNERQRVTNTTRIRYLIIVEGPTLKLVCGVINALRLELDSSYSKQDEVCLGLPLTSRSRNKTLEVHSTVSSDLPGNISYKSLAALGKKKSKKSEISSKNDQSSHTTPVCHGKIGSCVSDWPPSLPLFMNLAHYPTVPLSTCARQPRVSQVKNK